MASKTPPGTPGQPLKFDPDAAAQPGTGVFGLPHTFDQAGCVLVPAPFDATTSYGGGASAGPSAILAASAQVDLFDLQFGRVYEFGITMQDIDTSMLERSREARALAEPIIAQGGADTASKSDRDTVARVNAACEWMNGVVYDRCKRVLDSGRVPGLVGGDHSTPYGAVRACVEKAGHEGMGILHIDAHMDLRDSFEGFTWSHASIMFNILRRLPGVRRIVQVGIRDFGEGEMRVAQEPAQGDPLMQPVNPRDSWVMDTPRGGAPRVLCYFDLDLSRRASRGEAWELVCQEIVNSLPRLVYVSFDIDGLDPSLCPNTGTPVPGGLSFHQASVLLEVLARSGRRVIGFDLNEVCPGESGEWDANVGARVLYKLCGAAYRSNRGW